MSCYNWLLQPLGQNMHISIEYSLQSKPERVQSKQEENNHKAINMMLLKEWHKEKLPQLLKFNHSNTSILNKHKNNLFLFKNMFKKAILQESGL